MFHSKVFAHRGVSALAPENTMSAFTKVVQLGVGAVEFDCMQSADGALLIFHDDTLNRTTNGRGDFSKKSAAYLKTLDAGAWFQPKFSGERIPTLKEVAQFFVENKIVMNVELKPDAGREEIFAKKMLEELHVYLQQENNLFLFSSFSLKPLLLLRSLSKTCNIGILLHEWDERWKKVSDDLSAISVHLNDEIVTKERVQAILQTGRKVGVYTVNDALRASVLFDMGVNALFSDVPHLI